MVNTGKPSPGCFTCRSRRIKCDTTRPQCKKCLKRGWECPGYRDLNALRIVDETKKCFSRFSMDKEKEKDQEIIKKSRSMVNHQSVPPEESLSPPANSMSISTMVTTLSSGYPTPISTPSTPSSRFNAQLPGLVQVSPSLGTPIGEKVYCYFLTNFISGMTLRSHGYFDFLFPLLDKQPGTPQQNLASGGPGTPLSLSFSAVAMIAFAARQKIPELLSQAESMYLKALEATFEAIGDPTKAWDNSTLASVTLLTTFEQLRPSRPSHKKAEALGSHLDGALALIKMRGKDCFQTLPGRKIFVLLRSLLVSRSICYATPLDPQLHQLTDDFDQDPTQKAFAKLSLRAADLRVTVEALLGGWGPGQPSHFIPLRTDVASLLRQADALESEYAAYINALPMAWKPLTVRYMTASDAPIMSGIRFVGRIDAYVDMFICYYLNWARAARLYIHNILLRCHAWLAGPEADYRDSLEYQTSRTTCAAIVEDIVASVPYVFGWAHTRHASGSQPPSLSGLFCMWPVFAAASSDFASDDHRDFLKKTLKYISEEMGIGQAAILAEYNLRSPSMPITFSRMKQFQEQGKKFQGVASGAAAGAIMSTGLRDVIKTTGTVIRPVTPGDPSDFLLAKPMPLRILNSGLR